MNTVKIKRNTNGDTRVATKVPTCGEFSEANYMHIRDVEHMMGEFAKELIERASYHDWSKRTEPYKSTFYRELCNTIEVRGVGRRLGWVMKMGGEYMVSYMCIYSDTVWADSPEEVAEDVARGCPYDIDGSAQSISEASRVIGVSDTCIGNVARHKKKHKTAGGFVFEYDI